MSGVEIPIVAGSLGVARFAGFLLSSLPAIWSSYHAAEDHIQSVLVSLQTLKAVSTSLSQTLPNDIKALGEDNELLQALGSSLKQCEKFIKHLHQQVDTIQKLDGSFSRWRKTKYTWKQDDIVRIETRLDKHARDLNLILTTLQRTYQRVIGTASKHNLPDEVEKVAESIKNQHLEGRRDRNRNAVIFQDAGPDRAARANASMHDEHRYGESMREPARGQQQQPQTLLQSRRGNPHPAQRATPPEKKRSSRGATTRDEHRDQVLGSKSLSSLGKPGAHSSSLTSSSPASQPYNKPNVEVQRDKPIRLKGHTQTIRVIAYSLNGHCFASGSDDSTVNLWDIGSRSTIHCLQHGKPVHALLFSPNGEWLLSFSEYAQNAHLWNTSTGQQIRTFVDHAYSLKFTPCGLLLSMLDNVTTCKTILSDAPTGKVEAALNDIRVHGFSPDGSLMIASNCIGDLKIWEVTAAIKRLSAITKKNKWSLAIRKPRFELVNKSRVHLIAVAPAQRLLAFQREHAEHAISLVSTYDGFTKHTLVGHASTIRGLIFSPNANMLASRSACEPPKNAMDESRPELVKLWNVRSGRLLHQLDHKHDIKSMAFSADSQYIVTACFGAVYVWSTASGTCIRTVHTGWTESVDFSPDGRHLAVSVHDESIVILDFYREVVSAPQRLVCLDSIGQPSGWADCHYCRTQAP